MACSPQRPRLWASAVVAACLLVACEGDGGGLLTLEPPPAPSTAPTETRIVGFVGTLSGADSWRGEDAFEGADLGVHLLNRFRSKRAAPYDLRPLDDEGDARKATQLVEQLAELSSTVGIIYAGPPQGLIPAEEALAEAGVPALLCYGTTGRPLPAHVFEMGPPEDVQARRIAAYLAGDRGYLRVGAVAERSPEGDAALGALDDAVGSTAMTLVAARYGPGGGPQRALRRLRNRRVEAVVVPGGPGAFTRAVAVLRRWRATYTTTSAARTVSRTGKGFRVRRAWRPQPVGFDLAISARTQGLPPGAVAAESYVRGGHYLPLRSLRRFRTAFRLWWGTPPTGWEQRAFDAVRSIGWAAHHAERSEDVAAALEELSGKRFAGLPITFAPGDHRAVDPSTLGLWVVPRPGAAVPERARPGALSALGWVPLARSFVSPSGRWRILPRDRHDLVRSARRPGDRRRPYSRMLFGVRTPGSDPVH